MERSAVDSRLLRTWDDAALAGYLVDNSPDLLCIADLDGWPLRLNPAWQTMLGWPLDELDRHPLLELVHPSDLDSVEEETRAAWDRGDDRFSVESRARHRDGHDVWVRWTGSFDRAARVVVCTGRDVTEIRRRRAELADAKRYAEELARTDPLTGLPNRRALSDSLERLAQLSRRTGDPLSLALIDLDNFKDVNETGHVVGDAVLAETGRLLVSELRAADTVARWGGDEFCALFPATEPRQAREALERALERLLRSPLHLGSRDGAGIEVPVSFSAGVARVDPDGWVGDAFHHADSLLHDAKRLGRRRVLSDPA